MTFNIQVQIHTSFHCFRENDQIFLNDSETQGIRGLKSKLNISQEGMALDLFQKIALSVLIVLIQWNWSPLVLNPCLSNHRYET